MATQVKKVKRPNVFKRMGAWLGRSWGEFRKVTWPTPKTVFKNLCIVLFVVLCFLIAIGLADVLFSWLLGLLTAVKA